MGSALRTRMIGQMRLENKSPRTVVSYVSAVSALSGLYKKSPDLLTPEEVQGYLLHLTAEKHQAYSSVNVACSAFQYFFGKVLARPEVCLCIPAREGEKHLPRILSEEEVHVLLKAAENLRDLALLMTTYGAGVRVSELVALQPEHIESGRKLIRVEQGKGRKDRYTLLPDNLLLTLRQYWREYRPKIWLFPGREPTKHISVHTAQRAYNLAKQRAGISKGKGIHTLRHCFATHLLEAKYSIFEVKEMLGHRSILTTMIYLHLVPGRIGTIRSPLDKPEQSKS